MYSPTKSRLARTPLRLYSTIKLIKHYNSHIYLHFLDNDNVNKIKPQ